MTVSPPYWFDTVRTCLECGYTWLCDDEDIECTQCGSDNTYVLDSPDGDIDLE